MCPVGVDSSHCSLKYPFGPEVAMFREKKGALTYVQDISDKAIWDLW